jgi:amino acid transporter
MDNAIKIGLKRAFIGGGIAAIVVGSGSYLVGSLGEAEAIRSIEEMRPSLRFTCSAILTATTTILTLILTLLSFTSKADEKFEGTHYDRVEWIARLATIAFIAGIFLLLVLNLPLEASSENVHGWYDRLYYFLLVYGALLGGLMVTIVLMLYQAATSIIVLFHPDKESSLVMREDADEEESEKSEKQSVTKKKQRKKHTTTKQ